MKIKENQVISAILVALAILFIVVSFLKWQGLNILHISVPAILFWGAYKINKNV